MSEGSGPYEEEGGGLGWSQNGGSQATILALEAGSWKVVTHYSKLLILPPFCNLGNYRVIFF